MRAWPLVFCFGCRALLGIDEAVPLPGDGAPREVGADDATDAFTIDVPTITDDVAHVRAEDEYTGVGTLAVTGDWLLDTTSLTSTPDLPAGVTFTSVPQDAGGTDLAILRVDSLSISQSRMLRATGTRPLVILANSITIDGRLDVGALKDQPGAGGALGGPGVGGNGMRVIPHADSGGGGGGYAAAGAVGGTSTCVLDCNPDAVVPAGAGGIAYNSGLGKLEGGSGGGVAVPPTQPTACPAGIAGAGGGAVQLYARTMITVGDNGSINAGGGGGRGGFACTAPSNFLAGSGGGSGGAIFLQAPIVTNQGTIAANGGAGGSGGGNGGSGVDGEDGRISVSSAQGGGQSGMLSGRGGNGGTGGQDPQNGSNTSDRGNGGGGGGAVGWLVVFYKTTWNPGMTSPDALTQDYGD